MNEKLREAYTAILKSADLEVLENGQIVEDLVDKTPVRNKKGEDYYLPLKTHLRNHEGKTMFHPFRENWKNPESETYKMFEKYLVLGINLKLTQFITFIIELGVNIDLQDSFKNSKLVSFFESLEEMDASLIPELSNKILPKAITLRGSGALIGFFIKKNGTLGGESYAAVGKTNFHLYKEAVSGLAKEKHDDYRIFDDIKVRKKDLLAIISIMETTFPKIDDEDAYSSGTNNKLFRQLNALLLVTYTIASRMNEILSWIDEDLNDPTLTDPLKTDLSWSKILGEVYKLGDEIMEIENQDDVQVESHKLVIDESNVTERPASKEPVKKETSSNGRFIPPPSREEDSREQRREVREERGGVDWDGILSGDLDRSGRPYRSRRDDYRDDRRDDYRDDYRPSGWIDNMSDRRDDYRDDRRDSNRYYEERDRRDYYAERDRYYDERDRYYGDRDRDYGRRDDYRRDDYRRDDYRDDRSYGHRYDERDRQDGYRGNYNGRNGNYY